MGKMLPQIDFPNTQEQTESFEQGISLHFPSKSKDVENAELRAAWRKIEVDALKSVREFLTDELRANLDNSNTDEESLVVDDIESPLIAKEYRGQLRKDLLDINPQQAAREAGALEQTSDEAILAELEEELKDRYFKFIRNNMGPLAESRASEVGLGGNLKKLIADKVLIEDPLGKGGFGTIYRGYQYGLDRRVAVKIQDLSRIEGQDRERRLREARALARFDHPNILQVFIAEVEGEQGVIVSELVKGSDLKSFLLKKKVLAVFDEVDGLGASTILIGVAKALKALHENKDENGKDSPLMHRDVKPANIFLGDEGSIKLGDFGLTRGMNENEIKILINHEIEKSREASTIEGRSKTETIIDDDSGYLVGTPNFLAPEVIDNPNRGQPKSDIFSLGVVAWEMLSGLLPFDADTSKDVLNKILNEEKNVDQLPSFIPIEVRRFIVRMLSKKPEERPSAGEVAAFFEDLQKTYVLGQK